MTQVFFYHGAPDRLAAICHLLGKAAEQKKRVLVVAPEKSLADQVDRGLWSHTALSFHPHCRADSPLASETPIVIAPATATLDGVERLMNLGPEIPGNYQHFQSVIEVVGLDEGERVAARNRVLQYKTDGCDIRYVDLQDR